MNVNEGKVYVLAADKKKQKIILSRLGIELAGRHGVTPFEDVKYYVFTSPKMDYHLVFNEEDRWVYFVGSKEPDDLISILTRIREPDGEYPIGERKLTTGHYLNYTYDQWTAKVAENVFFEFPKDDNLYYYTLRNGRPEDNDTIFDINPSFTMRDQVFKIVEELTIDGIVNEKNYERNSIIKQLRLAEGKRVRKQFALGCLIAAVVLLGGLILVVYNLFFREDF